MIMMRQQYIIMMLFKFTLENIVDSSFSDI
jgi:hypothetical protein